MNLAPLEAWLHEHTGLDAATLGEGVVARAALQRVQRLACKSVDDYLAILAASPDERQALIECVVVPETWFFRDRPALDALARHVVGSWSAAHPTETFRVLSVPCATGEEPYSIAMALALAGWPLSRLCVDAVDISTVSLARAAEGVYRRNSFRGADVAFREAFFTKVGNEAWRIADPIRAPVHFAAGNVLAPGFTAGRERYHAVFCRNLLIYFSQAQQDRAVATLESLLAPGGWMAVGPAEPVLLFEHGFEAIDVPAGFLLRKAAARPPALPATTAKPRTPPVRFVEPKRRAAPPLPAAPRAAAATAAPADSVESIRALADAGRLREAAERGAALLARTAPTADLLYVLAVVADAAGDLERADALYRKALYLDPQHADAASHLALLAERRGDAATARRLRQRVQRGAAGGGA